MPDEPDLGELFKLPTQKTAMEWAFRALMVAAYFWSTGHFVSIDRYERDTEKQDAQRSILIRELGDANSSLVRIEEAMKNDVRRDKQIDDLEQRTRALEYGNGRHP